MVEDAVDAGVDHVDTAEYYGPHVVNELIRTALHPHPAVLVLVSKVGAARGERGGIHRFDEPKQLRQGIETTLLEEVPELTKILDVTDHGSGENPFYS